jgi:hypothetical protein
MYRTNPTNSSSRAEEAPKAEQINLKGTSSPQSDPSLVKSATGNEIAFKVKKTTPFEKIIGAYAQKTGIDKGSIKLLFDGQRIEGHQVCPFDLLHA